jgi:hypothetical protein
MFSVVVVFEKFDIFFVEIYIIVLNGATDSGNISLIRFRLLLVWESWRRLLLVSRVSGKDS